MEFASNTEKSMVYFWIGGVFSGLSVPGFQGLGGSLAERVLISLHVVISEIDGFEIRTAYIFALLVGSSEKGIHTEIVEYIPAMYLRIRIAAQSPPRIVPKLATCFPRSSTAGSCIVHAAAAVCVLLVQDKVALNYGGIDGTLPATGALDIRRIGDAGIAVAHGGAPGRSPCRVCRSLRVQAVRPKGTSDSTSTKRVAGSTGDWPLGGAMAVGWRNLWMAGPLQMRCLFSCFWVTAMLTPTPFPINALHHRGERSPRRSLFLAGPLVLPSLHTTVQKLCNIHLHRHPPSGIDRRGTPPVGGGDPLAHSTIAIPVPAYLPPRPSHRSTVPPAVQCPLPAVLPAKNCVGQESKTGRRGCSQTGKPVQISSPPDGTKAPSSCFSLLHFAHTPHSVGTV